MFRWKARNGDRGAGPALQPNPGPANRTTALRPLPEVAPEDIENAETKILPPPPRRRPTADIRVALTLSPELAERLRNAVAWMAGSPEGVSMASLCARALEAEVSRLEQEHHGGKPFPLRHGDGDRATERELSVFVVSVLL